MPPWLLKAAVQGVLAKLPDPEAANRLLQRYLTRSLELTDATFADKWRQCGHHVEKYRAATGSAWSGVRALELGTGWFPVVPIGLSVLGAAHVYTVDVRDHLAPNQVKDVIRRYLALAERGELDVPESALMRLRAALAASAGRGAREILAQLGVSTVIGDARRLPLPDGSIDLCLSNNTFEHIAPEVLAQILAELHRVTAPSGSGSHYVDMADHYADFDRSIGVYNYLKFPSWMWRLFNNELLYQNRLRLSDYRELHARAGWDVVSEEPRTGTVDELRRVRRSSDFVRYTEEDLRVYACWIVSRRSS